MGLSDKHRRHCASSPSPDWLRAFFLYSFFLVFAQIEEVTTVVPVSVMTQPLSNQSLGSIISGLKNKVFKSDEIDPVDLLGVSNWFFSTLQKTKPPIKLDIYGLATSLPKK